MPLTDVSILSAFSYNASLADVKMHWKNCAYFVGPNANKIVAVKVLSAEGELEQTWDGRDNVAEPAGTEEEVAAAKGLNDANV